MDFFFLLSSERSGSNLITSMLNNHPQICAPSPSHSFRLFSQNILNYGNLILPENWDMLLTDIVAYLNAQLGEWRTTISLDELKANIRTPKLANVLRYVYEKEASAYGKQYVFVKENKVYNFIPYLLVNFPQTKFVYLVRDPRDMALSYRKSANHPGGLLRAAEIWQKEQNEFLRLYGYLHEANSVFLLHYEQLVARPKEKLKALCAFLGLDFSDKMLEFYENEQTRKNAQKLKNWENLQKPVLSKNFNKYRKELTEEEIRYIEHTCRCEMEMLHYRFDYEPTEEKKIKEIDSQLVETEKNLADKNQTMDSHEKAIRTQRHQLIEQVLNRKAVI